MDSYVNHDLELAKKVGQEDDKVDALFIQVRKELIDLIREDKEKSEQAFDLLMIAKYLERIGDHAVNVSEWVIYAITGEHA